jgi:cytochrome c peroxidase
MPDQIAFTDVSNAIAVFMAHEWRSDTSEFDAVLRGEHAIIGDAKIGMELFYGEAGCAGCHSGPFLTDHDFHAMAAPQIGPGKSATFEDHHRDEGRFRVTGDVADLYAFRTPSLRNITLTGPYGHAGAHKDLDVFIAAHADPVQGLTRYDKDQAVLPHFDADDFIVVNDPVQRNEISQVIAASPVTLSDDEIIALIAFLNTLTDPVALTGRLGIPVNVPSDLSVPMPN